MRIYGYARVSSAQQNLDRQIVELKKYVDERYIFTDKKSGKDMDRPQYQLLRKVAQKGDIIYIKSLDRLGRNKQQIKEELEHYKVEGVRVKILDITTTMLDIQEGQEWLLDMINNLLIEVLSTMAEHERINIKTRQAEGIAALKGRNGGKGIGRPSLNINSLSEEQRKILKDNYSKWVNKEITGVRFMQILGLKKNSFYKIIKELEGNKNFKS